MSTRLEPVYRRSTPQLTFTSRVVKRGVDVSPDEQGKPLDLTGGTVTLYAKLSPDSATALLFSAVCAPVGDASDGKSAVRLTAGQLDVEGVLYLELRVAFSSGARAGQTLPAGKFTLPVLETGAP